LAAIDGHGWTSATAAAHYGMVSSLEYLTSKGVDFTARDGYGQTPLEVAKENSQASVMRYLLNMPEPPAQNIATAHVKHTL